MAALRTFYQRIIDSGASRRNRRNTSVFFRRLFGAPIATLGLICAGGPVTHAANFTCSWNDATANWTTVADWSNCNGTDPNNAAGNTYDATISTGDPTLTTAITVGSVTIASPGAWTLSGAGAAASLTGNITNSGTVDVDADTLNDGGSSLTVGGALSNSGRLSIGNPSLGAATTVQAASLSNTTAGTIVLQGIASGTTNQATLAIAGAAPSTVAGTFRVGGDADLVFGSGAITGIGSGAVLDLSGAQARVSIGAGTTNTALTGLASNAGQFVLEGNNVETGSGGVVVTTTTGLTNSGTIDVDVSSAQGGSSLTLGGALSNSGRASIGNPSLGAATTVQASSLNNTGTIVLQAGTTHQATLDITAGLTNSGTVDVDADTLNDGGSNLTVGGALSNSGRLSIGNPSLGAATTVQAAALSNTTAGTIVLQGIASGTTNQATLAIAGAAPSTVAGTFRVGGDADLVFGSGAITGIGSGAVLDLSGAQARVSIGAGTTNTALTGLASNAGQFVLEGNNVETGSGGVVVTTTTGLTNSGTIDVDVSSAQGGSSLTLGGALSNSGRASIGNPSLGAATTVQASSLNNTGTIVLQAGTTHQATLDITAGLTNSGTVDVDADTLNDGGSNLTVGGALSNSGRLSIGNPSLGAATTVQAAALSNTTAGTIVLQGIASGTTNQATLAIAGAAPSTVAGTFRVGGDADLVFGSGAITGIGSGAVLDLSGAQARVSIGAGTTNTALTGLASNAGQFVLEGNNVETGSGGVVVTTTTGLTNSGTIDVDVSSAQGGSSLTLGGALSNSGRASIGNPSLGAATTVQASSLNNTGTIVLQAGTTHQATLDITAGLTNSGTVDVDADTLNDGGSNLTVGGALSNSGRLSIGNPSLGAATTVQAAALSNTTAGTIVLLGNTSNLSNQANLTVIGPASNAGTVNIATASNVTVTGAGNAYTQTAGSTNLSGGSIAAPNVNINGGTVRGMGTVTGALNMAGTGTIEAINLGNGMLPAAITNDGNYSQSGGTFDAPLHGTGVQIDMVDVTPGHTVTLTGGDLEPFGVTFAAGQEFDDIMTFGPNELTGTFATILGGGDGTSVNLGDGLTLEAIYDNMGGDISLEVVNTVPVPAPPIGGGVPVFLAVSGLLFGAKLLERSTKRRSLRATIPHAAN